MSLIRQPPSNGHERQLRKIVRSPSLKKRASKSVPLSERVTLERVLGLTLSNNCAFDCDRNTGLIAYPAGCVIVLFNPRKNKQSHIFSHFRKTITALAFSPDGKYIVTGESGHMPAVRIWDVAEKSQVVEFAGHKFGITCVAFSPNNKYVVSVGSQHDMVVNVWDWKNSIRAASNKISSKVTAICFNESGNSFVTVGTRNVRFWYMSSTKSREAVPLHGRSGILGEQRNNFFCDVACGKGSNKEKTFCVTKSGLLCEFDDKRLLDKWVELRTPEAYCVCVSESYIFAGCANGIVRIFSADTLHYIGTLPRPHDLGVNVAASMDPSHVMCAHDNAQYPNAVAITHDDENQRLTAVYDDHSLYVWDVRDIKKIGKSWSFLYHSAPVWGVEFYPNIPDGNKSFLPAGSFITCSSDNTIRVWNMESSSSNDNTIKRNIFCNELLNIIYCDGDFSQLCESEETKLSGPDKTDPTSGEDKKGVRCICVSPNGQQLAAGDRSGNVHIYDFHFFDEIFKIEAHDAEVLCLEYSKPETGHKLLASASRDRLIHIFNVQEDYALVQTLDDHSSSITAVRFTDQPNELHMVSCGADKSIMFRTAVRTADSGVQFARNHHANSKSTFYDMATDASKKYVVAACQDRNLRIYNIKSGKQKRCYKGSMSDDGTLIRVDLDPSGVYAATSCSDKTLCMYDFYAGECVSTMVGHSELVTGLRFSHNCKNLISVSGDGCIFVWKLPIMFTQNMKERLAEMGQVKERPQYSMLRRGTYTAVPRVIAQKPGSDFGETVVDSGANALEELLGEQFTPARESVLQPAAIQRLKGTLGDPKQQVVNIGTREEPDYRFSVGPLPSWAKKQVLGEQGESPNTYSSPAQPRGRWAQRVDDRGFQVKSEWEDNASIQLRLAECMDRRRLTVEQDTLTEQKSRQISLASRNEGDITVLDDEEEDEDEEDDEFLPAAQRLKELEEMTEENLKDRVRTSRGSGAMEAPLRPQTLALRRPSKEPDENLESPSTPDREVAETMGELLKLENSEDDDTDDREVIIYLPTEEEEENASSDSPRFCVTQNTAYLKKYPQKWRKLSLNAVHVAMDRKMSTDSLESADCIIRNNHSKQLNGKLYDTGTDSQSHDNSEEDDEERPDTPFEEQPQSGDNSEDSKEKEDEMEFLKHNYESLAIAPEQEKFDNNMDRLEVAGTEYMQQLQGGRLSISTRFLTKTQQNHLRNLANVSNQTADIPKTETEKDDLSKRQLEMARAVEETRRRLQEMGYLRGPRKKSSSFSEKGDSTNPADVEKSDAKSEVEADSVSKPAERELTTSETANTDTANKDVGDKGIDESNKEVAEKNSHVESNKDESQNGVTAKETLLNKTKQSVDEEKEEMPTDDKEKLTSSADDAVNGQRQSKTKTSRTLPDPVVTTAMVTATLETVTIETSEITSAPPSKPDDTGRNDSNSQNSSPLHSATLRSRARSQDGLERIPTSRSRAARRARTERHLPALPTGKTPANTTAETTSTTTATTTRPRKSLYAPTESSLAKISSALHSESSNSPRNRRLKSQSSLDFSSPENEENGFLNKLSKEAEDKLVMPPPASATVTKTRTASRRSMSDPRSRNYSKARRFQPSSPTKEANRSVTITDPTTVATFMEENQKREITATKLQPSIDEEDQQQITNKDTPLEKEVKVEINTTVAGDVVKSNGLEDQEITSNPLTSSALENGLKLDTGNLSEDKANVELQKERRLTFDVPVDIIITEPETTTNGQQGNSTSTDEVPEKENLDEVPEKGNLDEVPEKGNLDEVPEKGNLDVKTEAVEVVSVAAEQQQIEDTVVSEISQDSSKEEVNTPTVAESDSQIAVSSNVENVEGAAALTVEDCTKAADDLHRAFTKAVKLHSDVVCQSDREEEKQKMLSVLLPTFRRMQETLATIGQSEDIPTYRRSSLDAFSSVELGKLRTSMAQNMTQSNNNQPDTDTTSALSLLDHYSDMLVTLVKNKITQKDTKTS